MLAYLYQVLAVQFFLIRKLNGPFIVYAMSRQKDKNSVVGSAKQCRVVGPEIPEKGVTHTNPGSPGDSLQKTWIMDVFFKS